MNLRDLDYVVAVAQHRNFSHAAVVCNVSQPALSNQIKKLERELGEEIFIRLSGEVRLTEFGARVVEIAERIKRDAQRIKDTATEYRDPAALPLKIGMTPTVAPYLTGYFAQLFRTLFPEMTVTMVEDLPEAMQRKVEDHTLDIALVSRVNHIDALDFTPMWSEPLYLAVRNDHPISPLPDIAPQDVPVQDFIRLPYSFGYDLEADLPDPSEADRAGKTFDLSALRFETVCRHVCHSDDCTIVSALAAEQFKEDRWPLTFIPFQEPGNLRLLGAATRRNCPRQVILEKIINYIEHRPPLGTRPFVNSDRGTFLGVSK